jgi:hypothetical protein
MYEIKMSSDTISVLKQLADINNTLRLSEGDELKSVASGRTIFAICGIDVNIPYDFNIFDLREFNQALNLFESPIVTFGSEDDGFVNISDDSGDTTLKYWESEEEFITSYPKKDIPQFVFDTDFILDSDVVSKVLDASKILKLPFIGFQSDGNDIYLSAFNVNDGDGNETNSYRKHVCVSPNTDVFNMFMQSSQMRVLNGTFKVEISRSKVIQFTSVDKEQVFFVTLESESSYD